MSEGAPAPEDPVEDSVRLFRRITKHFLKPTSDEPLGFRITSAAFQPSSSDGGVSINLEDTMQALGLRPEDLMQLPPEALGLSHVTAAQARDCDKEPVRSPNSDGRNDPSHGNLVGPDSQGRQRALARLATEQWVIEPAPEDLATLG